MKTLDEVLTNYKFNCLDGRDKVRLAQFVTCDKLTLLDLKLKEGVTEDEWNENVLPFTRENILKQLKKDVEFGFEKALDERGISSSFMFEVVKMWNWILEEGLENFNNYYPYGLPLFEKTAEKYGFEIPENS